MGQQRSGEHQPAAHGQGRACGIAEVPQAVAMLQGLDAPAMQPFHGRGSRGRGAALTDLLREFQHPLRQIGHRRPAAVQRTAVGQGAGVVAQAAVGLQLHQRRAAGASIRGGCRPGADPAALEQWPQQRRRLGPLQIQERGAVIQSPGGVAAVGPAGRSATHAPARLHHPDRSAPAQVAQLGGQGTAGDACSDDHQRIGWVAHRCCAPWARLGCGGCTGIGLRWRSGPSIPQV